MRSRPRVFTLLATAMILSTAAMAQGIDVQIPHLEYLDRGPVRVPYDQPIVVRIKDFSPAAHAGLTARLFRGEKAKLPRMPRDRIRVGSGKDDQCYIYSTWDPARVELSADGVDLGPLAATAKVGERWVVVFEEGEWKHGLIKISRQAVADYFSRGYEFIVTRRLARASRISSTVSDRASSRCSPRPRARRNRRTTRSRPRGEASLRQR
jgi:hypothetical protein